jgi:hypothetical protein
LDIIDLATDYQRVNDTGTWGRPAQVRDDRLDMPTAEILASNQHIGIFRHYTQTYHEIQKRHESIRNANAHAHAGN